MNKEIKTNELPTLISGLYDTPLPHADAAEAAHSLVGLFEVLLEIKNEESPDHARN